MKSILFTLILFFSFYVVEAQSFEKVPKLKTFEAGYRYNYSNSYSDLSANGLTIAFDYAWQLSGFGKKKAAYISVPLGYTYFPSDGSGKNASLIYYGWTVRHNLAKDKKFIPYLGYNLLLNQLKFKGVSGRDIGHETRFEFGYNIHLKEKQEWVIKLEYGMTFIPSFNQTKSQSIKYFGLKTGFRF